MKKVIFNQPVSVVNEYENEWTVINKIISDENQEKAFFVCDVNNIIEKYYKWKAVMPRIEPHYAVKCNDHSIVLQVLATLGVGFDCASINEINKVLSMNVDPSRIIYAHPTKLFSHIKHAASVNVTLTTFDNEMELHKLKKLYPNVRTLLRIRYDGKSVCNLGLKFGCDANTEAPTLLKKAQELGVNVVGVSFHVGSGCTEPKAFYGAIKAARGVFDCAATIGYKLSILDIGGGYPGERDSNIIEYANVINKGLNEYFAQEEIKVIAEPGAYFVTSAFTLVCNIHSLKKIEGNCDTTFVYYINDGIFGSLGDIVTYNFRRIPQPLKKNPEYSTSKKYRSTVWGPTCDSIDRIISDISLPEMEIGDWFMFTNMGSYTLTCFSPFNGFEPSDVFPFINNKNWFLLQEKLHTTQDNNCNKYYNTILED